jgi:NAD(P)-dependent dehydrogenase (short-subunit alcohol dehydrogenase family)
VGFAMAVRYLVTPTFKPITMKTAVITGASSGMGRATAMELAKQGYRVIIHGRDAARTKQVADEIKAGSGNHQVEFIVADITGIKGMKKLAAAIKEKTNSIEALVLSTGVILPKQIITEDGLEAGFAIQYLSRFAITNLLLDELKRGKARIVVNAAPKMKSAQIYFDDIALKNNFTMMRAMGQEMFANHLFAQEFAKRNPGNDVVMNILHVGVAKTGIMREANFFLKTIVNLFGKDPKKLTGNIVYLATNPEVNFSGYFLPAPGKPTVREKLSYDQNVARRLWEKSLELIK